MIRIRLIPARANTTQSATRPTPEMMEMEDNRHQSRSITFDAANILKECGYRSVRVAGSKRPFDVVAWKGKSLLFLAVKRSRFEKISDHSQEVYELANMVNSGVPGDVQFWLYNSKACHRYQIMPGGARPIQWGPA